MIFTIECTVSSVVLCTQSSRCEGDMSHTTLADVIKAVRVSVVADVCGVSQRAIYKWMNNGKLPRTEYTGETNYAEKIALASNGLFSADAVLTIGRIKPTANESLAVNNENHP